MLVQPNSELLAILNGLTADGGDDPDGRFFGAKVQLFKSDTPLVAGTVLGDLEEADFSGYAESGVLAFGAAFINDAGGAEIVAPGVQFTQTAATISNTVYGYMVVNAAGDGLLWAERFPQPIEFNAANKAKVVIPRYTLGRP